MLSSQKECARAAAARPWLPIKSTVCNATFLLSRGAKRSIGGGGGGGSGGGGGDGGGGGSDSGSSDDGGRGADGGGRGGRVAGNGGDGSGVLSDLTTVASSPRAAAPTRRVAVATSWDGLISESRPMKHYQCALLSFCQSAERFGAMLRRAVPDHVASLDVRLLVPRGDVMSAAQASMVRAVLATDCPSALVTNGVDASLRGAIHSYVRRGGARGRWADQQLTKWWAASLDMYDLIIFADLDVTLMRPEAEQPIAHTEARWRRTWSDAVPPSRLARAFATPDGWSPFNGGLWTLAWPSRQLYEAGVAVLASASFINSSGASAGFRQMGPPRRVANRSVHAHAMLVGTKALARNTWGFYGGDSDQAFLFFLLFVATDIGRPFAGGPRKSTHPIIDRYVSPDPHLCPVHRPADGTSQEAVHRAAAAAGHCPHLARHFIGGSPGGVNSKPWELQFDARRTNFSDRIRNGGRVAAFLSGFRYGHLRNVSTCARKFASWETVLEPWAQQIRAGVLPGFNGLLQPLR